MELKTDGLIVRENNNVGEADRFVQLLTRDAGLLRASARGAQKSKSRNSGVTRLLSYGRFTLHQGRSGGYIIGEVEPLHNFFDLNRDMERLSIAQYFCELCGILAPREEPADAMLRLMLLGLHHLNGDIYPPLLVKCVVEQRMLLLGGYAPDLSGCARCGRTEAESFRLSPAEGNLLCADCAAKTDGLPLSAGMLAALRHIHMSPVERAFRFRLPEPTLAALAEVSERFLLHQLGRGFRTLDFYHSLQGFGL